MEDRHVVTLKFTIKGHGCEHDLDDLTSIIWRKCMEATKLAEGVRKGATIGLEQVGSWLEDTRPKLPEPKKAPAKSRTKKQPKQYPTLELETLLYGSPPWDQIVEFWKDGSGFPEEHYLVAAIKKHLMTTEQRDAFNITGLTIEDALNGRNDANTQALVDSTYAAWNAKLGFRAFGF